MGTLLTRFTLIDFNFTFLKSLWEKIILTSTNPRLLNLLVNHLKLTNTMVISLFNLGLLYFIVRNFLGE